jgi:hypothetical protein
MGLFRRESLHERLAREGGVAEPSGVPPAWDATRIHGVARRKEWDLVATAAAPEIEGDAVDFVALPDGSLLVEEEQGEGSLEPLATAVEQKLQPPYRARGARQTDVLWAVSARRIDTASFEAEGERIELTETADGKILRIDGMPVFGSVPALEELGQQAGPSYAVHAQRLDADLWEVRVAAL